MNDYIESKIWDECYSAASDFYDLLKDARDIYNKDYYEKLNSYEGLFSTYVDEFKEVFEDAEKKRQSLGDDTLYNVPIKDILETLESHGFIFDKNTFSEYAYRFNFAGYLNDITLYHVKDFDIDELSEDFLNPENFKSENTVYRFFKSLANQVFNRHHDIYYGIETDDLNETIQIFTEVLNKFNDLDKNIEMNSETVFYGQPLKIILNDLRKLGLIVDKNSVGFEASTGEIIDIYERIEAIINITKDFLNEFKNWFTQPLHKEAQKSLDKEIKSLILREHMPALYKIVFLFLKMYN
jgi:hypothetical protein